MASQREPFDRRMRKARGRSARAGIAAGIEGASVDPFIRVQPGEEYLCALGRGEQIHYFADITVEGGPTVLHFTSRPDEAPQPAGSYGFGPSEPKPPWFPLFEQCVELYVADCCALS